MEVVNLLHYGNRDELRQWLEANHGILTGQRSDGEKIIHAIRKMIEEKKVSVNE